MSTTRLSTKGQLVIPREIRERQGWSPGIELDIEERGGAVVLRPLAGVPETEWVLRGAYGLAPETIADTFRRVLGYPSLTVEDREAVLRAVEWLAGGLDFADGLHLASSPAAERLVTFDRSFARAAARLDVRPPVEELVV